MLKGIVQNIAFKLIRDEQSELDQETSFLELLEIVDSNVDTKIEALENLRLVCITTKSLGLNELTKHATGV
jgi:hypothetical protein